MKRFLISSVIAFTILGIGVNAQAKETIQKYSAVENSAETVNVDTQINLGNDLTEELTQETLNEGNIEVDKIGKEDCTLNNKLLINIYKDSEVNIKPLVCKSKDIFISAKEIVNMLKYDIVWDGETSSITISNKEADKDLEELKIIVDGTEGFIDEGIFYIPLNRIVEYADLDYSINIENNSIDIIPKVGIEEIINQEDMTLYRVAKEIYDEDIKNETSIRLIKLKEYNKNINKDIDKFYYEIADILDGVFTGTKEIQAWKSKESDNEFRFGMSIKDKISTEEQEIIDGYIKYIEEKVYKLENPTDEEKVKLIDKEIRSLVSYKNDYKISDLQNAYDSSNTAYGAINTKKSVCQGYANLFTLLAEELDIPVIKVRGYGKYPQIAHVWNSVYIEVGGKLGWYYVDSTWNDTLNNDKHLLTTPEFEEKYRTWNKDTEQVAKDIKYKNLKLEKLAKNSLKLELVDTQK